MTWTIFPIWKPWINSQYEPIVLACTAWGLLLARWCSTGDAWYGGLLSSSRVSPNPRHTLHEGLDLGMDHFSL
jgi:hypothetical protein